jgi:hypothetical protein
MRAAKRIILGPASAEFETSPVVDSRLVGSVGDPPPTVQWLVYRSVPAGLC